jgi:N-acetylneuraminate synthase
MRTKFGLVTGLSDHTTDNTTAITSIALGASIIEKHVTLDKNGGGPDDSFSLEPEDLKQLCIGAKNAWSALGKVDYSKKTSEKENAKFRRSLYFIKDIAKGEVISEEHIKSIRPGYGLAPKYYNEIIGKTTSQKILLGTAVSWDHIVK